ncbi:hypothetical protein BJ912DRAFT_964395 [Pholiota molesta]|nr:hypothetical protein BJ912DRAFT_964395 [Pholiota molesta]
MCPLPLLGAIIFGLAGGAVARTRNQCQHIHILQCIYVQVNPMLTSLDWTAAMSWMMCEAFVLRWHDHIFLSTHAENAGYAPL